MVYSANFGGKRLDFGISGLLHDSNVLLYDRSTGSLWSQLKSSAVSGPHAGTRLVELPSRIMTWSEWRHAHPKTTVLSTGTGHRRDYEHDPYAGR